jgi:hypothetical protein
MLMGNIIVWCRGRRLDRESLKLSFDMSLPPVGVCYVFEGYMRSRMLFYVEKVNNVSPH